MKDLVADNERVHNLIYRSYEEGHGEIFNDVEQLRLRKALADALSHTESAPGRALDYGCGSGNLTQHLLDMGLHVTSADVSSKFLDLIKERYGHMDRSSTLKINGKDVNHVEKGSFDFVGTYSVLHHIPDYMQTVIGLAELVKPGGIIYLDHEENESYWSGDATYQEFLSLVYPGTPKKWDRFFKPSRYINKIKQLPLAYRRYKDPKYMPEGDIHVWPDDHIEWEDVEAALVARGYRIVFKSDYLVFKKWYPVDVYEGYRERCTDMRLLVAKRGT